MPRPRHRRSAPPGAVGDAAASAPCGSRAATLGVSVGAMREAVVCGWVSGSLSLEVPAVRVALVTPVGIVQGGRLWLRRRCGGGRGSGRTALR
eukprot:320863-Prymnesium_polylepis.1